MHCMFYKHYAQYTSMRYLCPLKLYKFQHWQVWLILEPDHDASLVLRSRMFYECGDMPLCAKEVSTGPLWRILSEQTGSLC